MLDAAEGLTQIKSQLMQRSGLEFQDVLDLLVIINKSGSDEFTESLAELRILSNASGPPFRPLTSNICRNIQSFLRLKTRLGWSTKVLDAAIYCLRKREMESPPSFRSNNASEAAAISVYVVKGIASIVKLSDLCGLEPAALIPLWGLVDSFGDKSLLHQKFLRSSLGEVFTIPEDGAYFQPGGKISKLQECGECVTFFKIFFDKEDPLANPETTLAIIQNWTTLLSSGWTIETLILALGKPTSDEISITGGNPGLKLASTILDGIKDLRTSLSSLFSGAIPTPETVVECAGRAFDSITATLVVEFVEGSQVRTNTITLDTKENLQSLIDASKNWPSKISVIPSSTANKWSAQFKLSGVLTTVEKQNILNESATLPAVKTALQNLVENSLFPQSVIKSHWAPTQLPADPIPSVNDISIENESQVQARRIAFIELAKPVIIQDTLTISILNTMKDRVQDVDITVLSNLLTDNVKVSKNESNEIESAMAPLKQLSVPVGALADVTTLDAYFTPTTTDDFRLHYTGALDSTLSLMINEIEAPFDTTSKTWNAFRMNAR
ncbi:hypothetical protein BCON_0019g00300 [Botryotinia convoluta]|uniref:Uncharacterized protein n=1 Tax=Botryotinia convoluta TaxID=54673 RepID=A0A4Z1IPE4_9HELO|nr:hypothetical protein BCON_0019g00300 [Botryotinia convoluta]